MQTTSPVEENARRASVDAGLREAFALDTPSLQAERTVTEDTAIIGEEPGINGHPERRGITPVETDPGGYTIHPRREHPGHMSRAERRDGATGGVVPRGVVLVTGPSRSAGIERTLEPGARSPCRLSVVLVEDDPAALTPEGHARCAPTPSLGPATRSPSPSTRSASTASRPWAAPMWRARFWTPNSV